MEPPITREELRKLTGFDQLPIPPHTEEEIEEALDNIRLGLEALDQGEPQFQKFLEQLYPETAEETLPPAEAGLEPMPPWDYTPVTKAGWVDVAPGIRAFRVPESDNQALPTVPYREGMQPPPKP